MVGELLQPGAGFNIDPATLDPKAVASYVDAAPRRTASSLISWRSSRTRYFGALARGDLLQILLISILSGFAISQMGSVGEKISRRHRHRGQDVLRHHPHHRARRRRSARSARWRSPSATTASARWSISAALIATFYAHQRCCSCCSCSAPSRGFAGFSILRFLGYIKDELLIVLGTSSSETVLPHMMRKMERLGASKSVVGLVIPTGYSFNLDGTNIYMTLATLFLAQATNTPLTFGQELGILVIAMITSKGASGVTGAGFVTLAATLAIVPDIPIQSLALLLGIDKFMSECRALTNLIGNGVATIVISRWEGELDVDKLHETMAQSRSRSARRWRPCRRRSVRLRAAGRRSPD